MQVSTNLPSTQHSAQGLYFQTARAAQRQTKNTYFKIIIHIIMILLGYCGHIPRMYSPITTLNFVPENRPGVPDTNFIIPIRNRKHNPSPKLKLHRHRHRSIPCP